MLVHRLHCWLHIKLTLTRCSFCGKYSVYSQCNILWDYALYASRWLLQWGNTAGVQSHVSCHNVRVNSIFGLAKLLIHCSPYRICWDTPKSMHTLEVDICILKTCLEVIICRAIKCLWTMTQHHSWIHAFPFVDCFLPITGQPSMMKTRTSRACGL